MKYPVGSFVLLMDGCFWRFYEVAEDPKTWIPNRQSTIPVAVSKKTKRQSPMKPSWHRAERGRSWVGSGPETYYLIPDDFVRARYSTEDDVINAFDMMRSVHEARGPSGEDVLERLNLIIEMTRSDTPD